VYDGSYYPSVVEAAEARLRKGDRQVYCPACAKWRWPEECEHPGRLTAQQFRLWVKRRAVTNLNGTSVARNGVPCAGD
jgi:hypothetical protein